MKKRQIKQFKRFKYTKREIKLFETLDHKYVVKYSISFYKNDFWYIIIEFINGKSLQVIIDENIKNNKNFKEKKFGNI